MTQQVKKYKYWIVYAGVMTGLILATLYLEGI
jgi:hypothetical protein